MIGSIEATGHAFTHTKPPVAEDQAVQPQTQRETDVAEATYMPQRISYEADVSVLVTEYRNVSTGEVRKQIPEPAMLESYRSRAALGLQDAEQTRRDDRTRDVEAAAQDEKKPEADTAPPPAEEPTGLGAGGAGGPAVIGPAPMGAAGNGLATPERPVGGTPPQPFRTVA